MDIIYIDTNIFESNNFFEGHRIKELYSLSKKGELKVVIPKLTYDEIENRLKKNLKIAHERFNKYRSDCKVLRNISSIKDRFDELAFDDNLRDLGNKLYQVFQDSKIEVIDYYPMDISMIFKKYFSEEFPFSSGKKKNEFPDAFAISIIENWAIENDSVVIVFSKDMDILKSKSKNLIIQKDFDKYIDEKLRMIKEYETAILQVDQFIEQEPNKILKYISDWIRDQLQDFSLYYDYTNYLEIHDIYVKELESSIDSYEIMQVDEEFIAVQFKIKNDFTVELTTDDDDYMIKDDDTKEWIYLDTTVKTYTDSKFIDLSVTLYPSINNQFDVIIEMINHDQKLKF